MKIIYVSLITVTMISLVACGAGGEEKKKEDKKEAEKNEEAEEPVKEEEAVDYSYVLPKIDTAALKTEEEILAAMEEVVIARKLDDSLAQNVSGYSGYYTELTNLYSAVTSKATSYASTLKSKESMAFSEKLFAITDKMYQ